MKKSILTMGKALTKVEQKSVNGGKRECTIQCTWILDPIACKCIPSGI